MLLATPVVAFWLWLVFVPARVAILCPEECNCTTGGYSVTCKFLSVKHIPLIHPTNVRQLWLYENNITTLEKDSFVSMTELDLLYILGGRLRTIELGAFNGITKLTVFIMQRNEIFELLPGTFENMKKLKYLDLSNNKLQHVDSDLLSGMFNLKYVDFSANKLQTLHPNIFLGLPNLKILYLGKNPGFKIPTDRHFINSNFLSTLVISNCNVSSLSVETFANVSALQRLFLHYNNLTTVDINILRTLPKLSKLYLHGNPLKCDCQLLEVWRWCQDRNIQTVDLGDVPECDTPSEVEGMWWGVLEKGQCLQGNIKYFGDYKNTSYSYTGSGEKEYDSEYRNIYDDKFLNLYQVPVYVFPFIFGTTGNVILLIIIICNKDMRTVPNMYILNLAISDIIYLMVFFSQAFANRINYMRVNDEFVCKFVSFCRRLSVGLSAYSVALYSFQRYRVTVRPFHVRVSSQKNWRDIVATFCGVWLVAALFAIPSTLSMNLCAQTSDVTIIIYYQHVVIFELIVACVFPVCLIAFSYIMTARHLVENSRPISEGTQNPQMNIRRNAAKIVVGLAVVFVISYVPYHVFWTYFICSQKDLSSSNKNALLYHSNYEVRSTYLISNFFLSINSCLNPVALFCTSYKIRQHLKRYLTCFCKTSSSSNDFELARRN